MKLADRAARMQRHHKRHKRKAGLNLVSLMDIFTILVFFLLVNSSDVEVLPNARDVQLPESIAEAKARETVVVLVTDEQLLVQGVVVASIADVMASNQLVIPSLKRALEDQTDRVLRDADDAAAETREVTIMGDKEIPYRLLKRVMATCTDANYTHLSLAVMQKSSEAQIEAFAASGA
ncbi:MAG TPA: biopolymer transporter ExbD [Gammaproteobacteria bacterium]|nr:biopolymer transporter ExbD [Gammaproteobacteria bacterium]